jgi:hypothetical protein
LAFFFAKTLVVSSKTDRRFYVVIFLLRALQEGYQSTASKKMNEVSHGAGEDSDEHLFHNVVSSLCQIL